MDQKGIAHLLPIVLIGIISVFLIFFFIVEPNPSEFLGMGEHVGPPPEEHEARLAWLSENVDNNDHKTFVKLDYEVPSWKELDKMNATLSRSYPTYIKATQTYGTLPNLIEVLYFGDVLKDLGVNTQFIHVNYRLKGKGLEFWYLGYDQPKDMSQDEAKRALVHNILLAKQQGLSVVLFPDYVQFEDGGLERHNVSTEELTKYLTDAALELAPLAEKYNVDYFVPVNQIETILDSNNYPVEETQNITNAFYSNVVPQVRKVYSGKVFYKMGGFSNWENFDGISLEGADIFGFTTCSRSPTPEIVSREVKFSATQATKMSKEYGIPWIGAEFVISNESDQQLMYGEVKTDYPIEQIYKVGLDAFDEYGSTASGFTVHSLLGAGRIYDTPAYDLVKTFFATQ
jgi:hypothetical protein